ncbi:MAG: HNH endonuclease signature motif containing protein [Actinomycetes bacterium]
MFDTIDRVHPTPDAPTPSKTQTTRAPAWSEDQPASLACLTRLLALDPTRLDQRDQVHYLHRLDAHVAWLHALHLEAIHIVAGEPTRDDESREEVATAIHLSPATAQHHIDTARALATRLPRTRTALHAGQISLLHANAIHQATAELTDQQASLVENRVLPRAHTQTASELRAALRRTTASLCPRTFTETHTQAATTREVRFWPEAHAMATIHAYLPAADAQTIQLALDALAHADTRDLPIDTRRADALTRLCTQALTSPTTRRRHGRPVSLGVLIDLPTLLGLTEHPSQLTGYGPIPTPIARLLARDATWHRLVTEPVTGHLLDYGHTTYRPPQQLMDYLIARDQTCQFPGCTRPAHACDADHTTPYTAGGPTSANNLRMLCRRHHRLKTHHHWHIHTHPDGSTTWTSPTGATYPTPPPTILEQPP